MMRRFLYHLSFFRSAKYFLVNLFDLVFFYLFLIDITDPTVKTEPPTTISLRYSAVVISFEFRIIHTPKPKVVAPMLS